MKNRVTMAQLSLLLMLVMMGGKFLSLPALLAAELGHDSWLAVAMSFLWDGVCLAFLMAAVRKNSLPIDKVLYGTLTPVGGRAVLAVFLVLFLCRIIVLLDSCYKTFAVTFDVNTSWILFVLPVMAVAAFAVHRGFNSVARTAQLLFAPIVLSIIAILLYPATQTQFRALAPVAEVGWKSIAEQSFFKSFWFSDFVFIYFVMDGIGKGRSAPVFVSFGVGAAITVLMNAVFVALFGSLAQHVDIAMSKIGLFAVSVSGVGRWDWLTFTVWLTSVILKIVVFTFCAYTCVEKICGKTFGKVNPFAMAGITVATLLPMFLSVTQLLDTFVRWCLVPFAVVQYVLPLFMPLLVRAANKKYPQSQPKEQYGKS